MDRRDRGAPIAPAALAGSGASPYRDRARARLRDAAGAPSRPRSRLGWADRVELGGPGAVPHLLGGQADRVGADPACSCSRSSAAARPSPQYRAFVVVGSALWSFVVGGVAGLAWSRARRPRALPDAQVPLPAARTRCWSCCSAAARRASLIAAMGAAITLVVGVVFLGVAFDLATVDWPLLVLALVLGLVGDRRARDRAGARSACRRARSPGRTPRRSPARCSSWSAPSSRSRVLPPGRAGRRPPGAADVVARGRPPGRSSRMPDLGIGGTGSLWTQLTGTAAPDPHGILAALLVTTAVVYTRCAGVPTAGASTAPRSAALLRPDHRVLTPADPGDPTDAHLRGHARARTTKRCCAHRRRSSTNAPCARCCSPRRPTASSSRAWPAAPIGPAWSEDAPVQKETYTFLDDDIARFMEEAAAGAARGAPGAGPGQPGRTSGRSACSAGYFDQQKPRDVFFFEQDGAYVRAAADGRHGRGAPRAGRVHARRGRRWCRAGAGAGGPRARPDDPI